MKGRLGKRKRAFPGAVHPRDGLVYPLLRGFICDVRARIDA